MHNYTTDRNTNHTTDRVAYRRMVYRLVTKSVAYQAIHQPSDSQLKEWTDTNWLIDQTSRAWVAEWPIDAPLVQRVADWLADGWPDDQADASLLAALTNCYSPVP